MTAGWGVKYVYSSLYILRSHTLNLESAPVVTKYFPSGLWASDVIGLLGWASIYTSGFPKLGDHRVTDPNE